MSNNSGRLVLETAGKSNDAGQNFLSNSLKVQVLRTAKDAGWGDGRSSRGGYCVEKIEGG